MANITFLETFFKVKLFLALSWESDAAETRMSLGSEDEIGRGMMADGVAGIAERDMCSEMYLCQRERH